MTYRFGRFSIDGAARQVLAGGQEVHLSPKAFELLLMLIEQRSRALSKAELQERLWLSTFVGETSLATLVAEIRRVLDDTARDSLYVRTVHRFGYRFVAEVAQAPSSAAANDRVRMYLTQGDRRFALADGTFVIGRAPEAAIQVDAGGVSRLHARVTVSGGEARLEDLGSKNGTFVRDEPLTGPCLLRDGDEVRVGPVTLTFKLTSPTTPTETMLDRS